MISDMLKKVEDFIIFCQQYGRFVDFFIVFNHKMSKRLLTAASLTNM